MYEIQRADGVASEKAILVARHSARPASGGRSAGRDHRPGEDGRGPVVSGLVQRREAPDVTTYIGKGKVEELKGLVEHHDADVVIFDNDLSPARSATWKRPLGVKVLDRSELILDIFATQRPDLRSRAWRSSWPSSNTRCRG